MERRLVTILAADAVGYSRRMERDESGALAELSRCRSIIDQTIIQHGGRIFGSAGDSVVAEFASSVNAVQSAILIQKRLEDEPSGIAGQQPLNFRIGINLGDVIVQGDNLLGDGVNVAARLEAIAPAKGICISKNVMEQIAGKVEARFGAGGKHKLKNIEKPVDVWCWPESSAPRVKRNALRQSRLIASALAAVALILALGLGYAHFARQPEAPIQTDKATIAVLPFANMSRDPDQEYFVDGMTEDLITDLSKISALFVIARDSVFAYKGRTATAAAVARELGVRYVLEGSVRKSGGRVRINSQLIDVKTGGQIWADRFDREIGDIFNLQDDVTRKIVAALALQLTSDDKHRLGSATRETSPEVYDLYLRGVDALRQYTPETIARARGYLLKALAMDPDFARAYATLAFTYTASGIFFREHDTEDAITQALRYGKKALELDDKLPQGHFAMAIAYLRQGRHDEALAAAKEAVRNDPNYADGYVAYANVLIFLGRGSEAADLMNKAMGLNPRYSAAYIDILGRAHFMMGRYDQAIENFQDCIRRDAAALTCHIFLAATYAAAGKIDNAKWEAEEIRTIRPDFTIATDTTAAQFANPEDRARLQSWLRQAGIAEN